ncbi:KAP family P-loop NTPase fold protein [Aeromonas caviae]|uniref:KAP family P-loop NTPase fold protein n=1 Tax=Aeromonas caviae TaxID=648 RepID=UPI0038D14989
MGKYHNDQPIHGGCKDSDQLNRADFANNLANILLLNHEEISLTVSLEGEWGYGKTSVINLVKGSLNEKENLPIVVEYNPWLAGNPESLIQDFLLQFSSQLNISDASEDALNAAKELIAYSSLFSVAKLVPGAEPWASIIENVFSRFGNATKKIAELKKLDLLGKKNSVIKAISKINRPIVVIIDDIDRLTPAEAFQVLRLVKAVADFPRTSFLLAFDPNYLTSVLDKNDIINSHEYINKIIQLRVPLPVISETGMNELADFELESLNQINLTQHFEQDQERLSWIYHMYFKHLIKNPRELKRCFNHLRFILEQIEGQVCFADLFSLSIIATKANSIYEHIKCTPEAYIGKRFENDGLMIEKASDVVKKFEGDRNNLLGSFNSSDRALISGLISDIFPLLNSNGYSHYSVSDGDAAGRVSSPQRLYVAFHYKTPIGHISDKNILEFINGEVDRISFINELLKENADERFFEMMTNYSSRCKENSFDILTSIYDCFLNSDKLKIALESNYGFLSKDIYRQINWLTNKIISDYDDKYSLIKRIIERESSAPLGGDLLYKVRGQCHGEYNETKWVNETELKELEEIFQSVAIHALSNKIFIKSHLEPHIFFELKRSSKLKAAHYIIDVLNYDGGIIRVAEIIGHSGTDSSNGPFVQIEKDDLHDIVNLDELKEHARKVNLETQPIHIQAVIKSILDGKKYYLRDGSFGGRW